MQQKMYRWILLVLAVMAFSMATGKDGTAFTLRPQVAMFSSTDRESQLSSENIHLGTFILNGSAISFHAREQVSDLFPACFSGDLNTASHYGRLILSVYSSRVTLAYKDTQFLLLFPFHFFT